MHRRNALRFVGAGICALAALAGPVHAADPFPSKPIRWVLPVGAGNAGDVIARWVAEKMTPVLGQPIVIDNRPGGGGMLALGAVAAAPPDGHTIAMVGPAMAITLATRPALPFDPRTPVPVTQLFELPYVILVNSTSNITTMAELLALAKERGNKMNYASIGIASTSHLAMEFFKPMAGITPTHVPYKTAVSALTDLSSGQVDVMFENLGTAAPYLTSKRLRALAFGGATRSKVAPDVPTFTEVGFPEYNVSSWTGIYASPGTPKPIIDRLNQAFVAASQSAELRQRVAASFSADIKVGTPQQLDELVRFETSRIAKAVAAKTLVLD